MAALAKGAVKAQASDMAKKVGGEKLKEATADPEPEPYITSCASLGSQFAWARVCVRRPLVDLTSVRARAVPAANRAI